jgi:TPP-dependent pyruvate/acetoin dehydrogenase alpha subunit
MFGAYLIAGKVLDDAARAAMEEEIRTEITAAFEFALASPNPVEADLYRHVYAE